MARAAAALNHPNIRDVLAENHLAEEDQNGERYVFEKAVAKADGSTAPKLQLTPLNWKRQTRITTGLLNRQSQFNVNSTTNMHHVLQNTDKGHIDPELYAIGCTLDGAYSVRMDRRCALYC